ncbi:MAG: phenylalanine--tRNA ligase subunit beta [Elusimicrobiota bacterium]
MKISYNLLGKFISLGNHSPEGLAEILLGLGFEVSGTSTPPAIDKENIISAVIESVEKHPSADNLTVVSLDDGRSKHSVICGAKNVSPGDIVPLALPGAVMADGTRINAATVRGIKSPGMLCSSKELGIDDDHSGILILPDGTPSGKPVYKLLGFDDVLLEIDVPPNRPDCLSHIGIARELSAKLATPLKYPDLHKIEKGTNNLFPVEITEPGLCMRYIATVIRDVRTQPSPPSLRIFLKACGIRPVNNIVDITNYVLLEMGHALHVFDMDKLSGQKIVVRRANAGEKINALDGRTYTLAGDMLVIADTKPQAIAGIIGAETSAVDYSTKNVLLESAVFSPQSIRSTRQKLGISTEASYRFERGSSWTVCETAMRRAVRKLKESKTGNVVSSNDVHGVETKPLKIPVRPEKVNAVLATNYEKKEIADVLSRLEFSIEPQQDYISVEVPGHRQDIGREVDIIEDIARVMGYETIPTSSRYSVTAPLKNRSDETIEKTFRQVLSGRGFAEATNYTLVSGAALAGIKTTRVPVEIENPISAEYQYLCTTLLSGLLQNVFHNINNQFRDIKLFESSRVFAVVDQRPVELPALGIICMGDVLPEHWGIKPHAVDFYYIKGIVEELLDCAGFDGWRLDTGRPGMLSGCFLQNNYCTVTDKSGGNVCVEIGMLDSLIHPEYQGEIYYAELYPETIKGLHPKGRIFSPYPVFPKSKRDISIVIPEDIEYAAVDGVIRETAGESVNIEVVLFDIYRNEKIGRDKKCFGIRLTLTGKKHTLTDADINGEIERILSALKPMGITLRSG